MYVYDKGSLGQDASESEQFRQNTISLTIMASIEGLECIISNNLCFEMVSKRLYLHCFRMHKYCNP